MKKKILFVCLHNSARSQMAEGLLRHYYGESYEAFSAGAAPTRMNPLAVEAMKEAGIDISHQEAKGLDALAGTTFDLAVTVCGADASCPFIPNARTTVHRDFDDPSSSNDIETFRKVRDGISEWIRHTFKDPARLPGAGDVPTLITRGN